MSVFEAIQIMITFGLFTISLIDLIVKIKSDNNKK